MPRIKRKPRQRAQPVVKEYLRLTGVAADKTQAKTESAGWQDCAVHNLGDGGRQVKAKTKGAATTGRRGRSSWAAPPRLAKAKGAAANRTQRALLRP